MIFLDTRYVSPLLTAALSKVKETIFDVTNGCFLPAALDFHTIDNGEGIIMNAEIGMEALNELLPDLHITNMANIFKNKMAFRKLLASRYPNFFYQSCTFKELKAMNTKGLPFPIVLKPIVGYGSEGVYKFNDSRSLESFIHTYQTLKNEEDMQFILEQYIDGKEFAVDLYYDEAGEPVILNIFGRNFKDSNDVGDRIYYTSKDILSAYLPLFYRYLKDFGESLHLKMMPLHIELRVNTAQQIVPIEVNPLRFAGEGTTELGYYAYHVNPYEYYFNQQKPDWKKIVEEMDDSIYSFTCAEMDKGIEPSQVESINHAALKKEFEEVLDYRLLPLDGRATFAVVFFKSKSKAEHTHILNLDFMKFIRCRQHQLQ